MPKIYQVSEILAAVNSELWTRFSDVAIEGEITNFTRAASGHCYFSIKDSGAQLSVTLFQMYARGLRFKIENGLKVVARGRLRIYEQTGKFQLNAVAIEPVGLGALQLAFEQLKARLTAEGLFEAGRKRPIPMLPQKIAVVTSPTGAAIRDILHVLGRRFEGLSIQIYPVRVQGQTAAREIALALVNLSRWELHDVILLCRGGGSLEDLWPFNEEIVARAIATSTIPVISGVGHETDFTIADFVADLRAPTPSAAAEIVVRAKTEICSQIEHSIRRIRQVVEGSVRERRHQWRHLVSSDGLGMVPGIIRARRARLQSRRVSLYRLLESHSKSLRMRLAKANEPLARFPGRLALRDRARYLDLVGQRSVQALRTRFATQRRQLEGLVTTLQAVSPLSVLARGYAIAFSKRGGRPRPLYDSAAVALGERIEVRLRRGRLDCTVDERTMGLESLWPEVAQPLATVSHSLRSGQASDQSEEESDGATARK